ncbi:MAG: hypothetical protein ACFCD0_08410 [Gemmataceae bacterium]
MLDKLPKPLLFGLCGAIGGLLMALIPGELFFFLLRPPYIELQMSIPSEVTIYPGGKNFIEAKLSRANFRGTVKIEGVNPPAGITVDSAVVDSEEKATKVVINVEEGLKTGQYSFQIRARDADSDKVFGESTLSVEVKKAPAAVLLSVPNVVGASPGGSTTFVVRIGRSKFQGPVRVDFEDLPDGVKGKGTTILPGSTEGRLTLDIDPKLKPQPGKNVRELTLTTTAKAINVNGVTSAQRSTKLAISNSSVDVVFVVDITASMNYAIDGIKRGVDGFTRYLAKRNLDVRLAFVGFRDRFDPPAEFGGRAPDLQILQFGPKREPFTRSSRQFAISVGKLIASDGGESLAEDTYYGLIKATELPFRPGAAKVLVFITDAEPINEPVGKVPTLNDAIAAVKKAGIDQIHLLIHTDVKAQKRLRGILLPIRLPANDLPFYEPLQKAAGSKTGLQKELDLIAAGKIDFANALLPDLGKRIVNYVGGTRVTDVPPPPSGVAPSPASARVKGVQSAGQFAKKNRWRLLLAVAWWTAIIAGGISIGILQGQHYDLQRRWLSIPAAVQAIGAGFLAGFIGGALGQLLFTLGGATAVWDVFGRILGWTLLGALVGLGVTLFAPNLSKMRGLAGGALGGLSAALVFLLIMSLLGALLGPTWAGLFGRWIGAAVLGFLIGLMVALADVLFRRYWLEIAFGRREVRTVTLGSGAVVLGSDESQVSVFVPDAPPVALRYWMDGDVVICEDATTRRTAAIQPGHTQPLAGVTIKVCSVETVESSGLVLELSTGRDVPLSEGMPLTAEDLPGLRPKGSDGIVALLSPRPADPTTLLFRNRSLQKWIAMYPDGRKSEVGPGFSVEALPGIIVHFAKGVHGRFAEPQGNNAGMRKAVRSPDRQQQIRSNLPPQSAARERGFGHAQRPSRPVQAQPAQQQSGRPVAAQPVQAQPVQAQPVPAKVGAECPSCRQYIEGTPGRRYCERCGKFF